MMRITLPFILEQAFRLVLSGTLVFLCCLNASHPAKADVHSASASSMDRADKGEPENGNPIRVNRRRFDIGFSSLFVPGAKYPGWLGKMDLGHFLGSSSAYLGFSLLGGSTHGNSITYDWIGALMLQVGREWTFSRDWLIQTQLGAGIANGAYANSLPGGFCLHPGVGGGAHLGNGYRLLLEGGYFLFSNTPIMSGWMAGLTLSHKSLVTTQGLDD